MLQKKVYICYKVSSNHVPIQKSTFKKQKRKMPYLIAPGDHRKTIKGIKVLCVECTPVSGIAIGIVIAHNSRP